MKSIIAGLSLALLASSANASTLKDVLSGSFKLYFGDKGGCSTELVAEDTLATANHCNDSSIDVDGNATLLNVRRQVLDKDFLVVREEVAYVKAVKTSKDTDMVLLQLVERGPDDKSAAKFTDVFPGAKVIDVASPEEAKAVLDIGSPVTVVGYPMGKELTVTRGEFAGSVRSPAQETWKGALYKITAPITGGNSGGGLYFDFGGGNYKLIGITVAGYKNVSFMNYATRTGELRDALTGFVKIAVAEKAAVDKAEIKEAPAQPRQPKLGEIGGDGQIDAR